MNHARDLIRRIKSGKSGVKLTSITQQTSEDSSGQMARKMYSVFDEYQSAENSKHTLRAGIQNFRGHGLRHTWASWQIQKGTNARASRIRWLELC